MVWQTQGRRFQVAAHMDGKEFKDIRLKLGLSQNELARDLGILSGRTIQRIEKSDTVSGPMALAMRKLLDDSGK